jgi:hypothetical protein
MTDLALPGTIEPAVKWPNLLIAHRLCSGLYAELRQFFANSLLEGELNRG